MVRAATESFKEHYSEIMKGAYHQEILKDCSASGLVAACKRIGREFVYVSNETLKLELFGNNVIQRLLTLFWNAASNHEPGAKLTDFNEKMYHLASPNYRSVFEAAIEECRKGGKSELYARLQLATDQISGMTDTFACDLCRELTNG